MACIVKILESDRFLIVDSTGVKTTSVVSDVMRKGIFSDLPEVYERVGEFDKNMKFGKDYVISSVALSEEIKIVLDIKLLIKILQIFRPLIIDDKELVPSDLTKEIRKVKKHWSWYNCMQWVSGERFKKALLNMNEDEFKQLNLSKAEIAALVLAMRDSIK
jgi:hypothetical protein